MRTGAFIKLLTARMMNLLSSIKTLLCFGFDVILCCLAITLLLNHLYEFFLNIIGALFLLLHFRVSQTFLYYTLLSRVYDFTAKKIPQPKKWITKSQLGNKWRTACLGWFKKIVWILMKFISSFFLEYIIYTYEKECLPELFFVSRSVLIL